MQLVIDTKLEQLLTEARCRGKTSNHYAMTLSSDNSWRVASTTDVNSYKNRLLHQHRFEYYYLSAHNTPNIVVWRNMKKLIYVDDVNDVIMINI